MSPVPRRGNRNEEAERLEVAERLKNAREYLGFSQDQVAQYLGVPRSALSNMETGQRKVEVVELKRLAELYKRPVAYFTGETPPPSDALPPDVEHLARKASRLTAKDRQELARFVDFLKLRSAAGKPDAEGDHHG